MKECCEFEQYILILFNEERKTRLFDNLYKEQVTFKNYFLYHEVGYNL